MLRRTQYILAIVAALVVKSLLALSNENPASHHVLRSACSPTSTFLFNRGNDPACSRRRALLVVASSGTVLSQASPAFALAKDLKEEYRQGTAALADDDSTAPVPREAYKKLDSGVVYADLRTGNGEAAKVGSRVNLQWVLRKSNGYFVDSSEVNGSVPFIFTVGDGTAIAGLNEAIQGMKVGGVRRILIPPSLAYVDGLDDGKPGPLPTGFGPRQQMRRVQTVRKDVPGEYVYLEVQMTRLR
jgi:FKBP-type peptidyl-prolyl cis-trans isomerase